MGGEYLRHHANTAQLVSSDEGDVDRSPMLHIIDAVPVVATASNLFLHGVTRRYGWKNLAQFLAAPKCGARPFLWLGDGEHRHLWRIAAKFADGGGALVPRPRLTASGRL